MNDFISSLPLDNPILLLIIGVVGFLFLAGIIVKALFRIGLIAAVIGGIAIFVFGFTPEEVIDKGVEITEMSKEAVNEQVKPILMEQIENSTYEKGKNGAFSLKNENFALQQDENGEITIQLLSHDLSFSWEDLTKVMTKEELQQFIQAIENQKQS